MTIHCDECEERPATTIYHYGFPASEVKNTCALCDQCKKRIETTSSIRLEPIGPADQAERLQIYA